MHEDGRATGGGELNAAIAQAVVRVHRAHLGRGPTKASAFHRGALVVTLLEDSLTQAERGLVEGGRGEAVLAMRRELQTAMRPDLVEVVEALTERRVRAFLSDQHLAPDVAVEAFVLEQPLPSA